VHHQLGREALWAAARVHDRGAFRRSEVGRRALGAGPGEQEQNVSELLDFAAQCWPELASHTVFRKVQAGDRLGLREFGYMIDQKGRWWLRRRSWKYRGY
jgi:hypothetical protein